MTRIDNITDQASQRTQPVLADGSVLTIDLLYNGATQHWSMTIQHTLLATASLNVCAFPNILREWRNLIAFGIACITTTGQDPTSVDDFINGVASLYLLDEADVLAAEDQIFGGVLQ